MFDLENQLNRHFEIHSFPLVIKRTKTNKKDVNLLKKNEKTNTKYGF